MPPLLLVDDLNSLVRVAIVNDHELLLLDADLLTRQGLLDSIYYARVLDISSNQVTWELAPELIAKSSLEPSFPSLSSGSYRFVQITRESFQEAAGGKIVEKPAEVTQNLTFVHRSVIYQPLSKGMMTRPGKTMNSDEQRHVILWHQNLDKTKRLAWSGPNCLERILREQSLDQIEEILIRSSPLIPFVQKACAQYAPSLLQKIRLRLTNTASLLEVYGFEDQWSDCLNSVLTFKAGAQLIFQQTSVAMMIDVNTGKLTPHETNEFVITQLAQQLIRRRLSGRILIDFAGLLKNPKERESLLTTLKFALEKDRPKWHILGWSKSGLLELQRERRRIDLSQLMEQQ
jgi:hypothetical protein